MKTKVLSRVLEYLLAVVVFLLPLAFLPFFTDSYDFGKMIFLLGASFIIFVIWLVDIFINKKVVYKKGVYFLPLFLLLAAFVVSTLVNSTNKMQSLVFPTSAGALLIAFVFYLLLDNLGKRRLTLISLLASGAVLSILRLILFVGNFTPGKDIPLLNLTLDKIWSPTGNLLAGVIFLLLLIPIGYSLIYEEIKQKKMLPAIALFMVNTLNLAGLGLSFYLLSTLAKPTLLPQGTAWAIALETLKNVRFALFGLAPGQFINGFTAFRSLSFNNTDLWNLRFGTSSNWYFQLLTETGFVGLIIYLLLAWKIIKDGIKVFRAPRVSYVGLAVYLALIILLVAQLFLPLNFFLLSLMFLLLALAKDEEQATTDLSAVGNLAFLLLVFPLAFWGTVLFFAGRFSLANHYFLNSLKAIIANDGVKAYNLQIKAIQTDSSSATYRTAYSQTNFALANSLAANPPAGGLTDADRSTITQLIQQSIQEAKAAVAIDPNNASGWENLAGLYQNLLNFAEGAGDWAVSAYQQAIALDPLNPRLRINLGGLYYSQKNWNQAANLFSQAASLKPDLANAHYNLANALREMGALADSAKEYETTQTLVKIDSADYQKVTSELEEVKKRLPTPTPMPASVKKALTPETLSTPPTPAAGIEPPLKLPEEAPVPTVSAAPAP